MNILEKIVTLSIIPVPYPAIFRGAGISTCVARRKTVVQPGSLGGRRDPSLVGVQKLIWLFCILNSLKHRFCSSATTNGDESLHQKSTLLRLAVWVWDPKSVYRLQNSSGYGTKYFEQAFSVDSLCYNDIILHVLSYNNSLIAFSLQRILWHSKQTENWEVCVS